MLNDTKYNSWIQESQANYKPSEQVVLLQMKGQVSKPDKCTPKKLKADKERKYISNHLFFKRSSFIHVTET